MNSAGRRHRRLRTWRAPRRRRAIFLVAGIVAGMALGAGGGLLGVELMRWRSSDGFTAHQYALGRARVIQAHLDRAPPGAIIVAGDSHAELTPALPGLCGRPVLNAGVSGATARGCADLWHGLTMARARAIILTIGVNNLLRKRHNSPDRFAADIRRLLGEMAGRAEVVAVSAIPPAAASTGRFLALEQTAAFTAEIRRACADLANCVMIDLYAADRAEAMFGLARTGAMADGLHFRRYARRYDETLCSAIDNAFALTARSGGKAGGVGTAAH